MNINQKIANDKKRQREIVIYERRSKIAKILRKNPYIRHAQIAKAVKVSRSTVTRDIREMNEEIKSQTMDDFMVQRKRVLNELQKMKRLCARKLNIYTDKTKGARWLEEWSSLTEKECKILGLYVPEKIFIGAGLGDDITSEQKDAAVDAAVRVILEGLDLPKQLPASQEVIDVTNDGVEAKS